MSDFIAKTHEDWASFLREEGIIDNANFWAPRPKPLLNDLPGNHIFFFSKVPPNYKREIVGWGKVARYSEDSVARCWDIFGPGNGANSLEELLEHINAILPPGENAGPDSRIGVNVIDEIVWLENPLDIEPLGIYVAPSVVRGRRLTADEATAIMGRYGGSELPASLRSELALLSQRYAEAPPSRKIVISNQIERNALLTKKLKSLHRLNCQLCGGEFFFKKGRRTRYSEVHHIRELCKGGLNSTDNCLVLCANCHRRMHYGDIRLEDLGDKIRVVEAELEFIAAKNILC